MTNTHGITAHGTPKPSEPGKPSPPGTPSDPQRPPP